MPAFFVVGAAKAGTTALHNILLQHPNVFLPQMKETNYFAFQGETVDFKGPLDDQTINRFSITAAADYASLFDPAAPGQRSGEVCRALKAARCQTWIVGRRGRLFGVTHEDHRRRLRADAAGEGDDEQPDEAPILQDESHCVGWVEGDSP